VFASVYRRCIQGIAEAQRLRLAAAGRYYAEALPLAEQHVGPNSIAALPASLISRIRYEQGQVEEADCSSTGSCSSTRARCSSAC
jgi:LuxR family transcriptional regulator, maltose regulon positive regulatory protein